ncbi:hypothetical protein KP509_06G033100 [Ceratopteris richardii]|nr:hypothetical protein KP509_06G033100 [Ceratopteris richardii]
MSDPSALGVNGFGRTIRGPVSKVIDPDVAALLEVDDDGSIVSDDELEDDFVIVANENAEGSLAEKNGSEDEFKTMKMISDHVDAYEKFEEDTDDDNDGNEEHERPARLLDEQFELLALREYDDDEIGEVDDDDISAHGPAHISKFNHIMSDFLINNAYIPDKYQTPAEIKSSNEDAIDQLDSALNKSESCPLSIPELDKRNILVSAISYESSTSEKDLVVEEDSDSEGSMWDCESIVTKYSNLDNHPGKICAIPKVPRKNSKQNEDGQSVIRLGGKQQLPVDYLPKKVQSQGGHKNKGSCESKTVNVVQRRADETKEEKKARKAAIKEERRNARASKKDLKLIYKDEAHRAQKTAASTGPATLRL